MAAVVRWLESRRLSCAQELHSSVSPTLGIKLSDEAVTHGTISDECDFAIALTSDHVWFLLEAMLGSNGPSPRRSIVENEPGW